MIGRLGGLRRQGLLSYIESSQAGQANRRTRDHHAHPTNPQRAARPDRPGARTAQQHAKRGPAGVDDASDASVLGQVRGIAVYDVWAHCNAYLDVKHQLCYARALRELLSFARQAAGLAG